MNQEHKQTVKQPYQRQQFQQLSYFIRRHATIQCLKRKGIEYFFPIQYQTFDAIKFGSDLIGKDRTGSGKTIAYSLPILQRMRNQQALAKPQSLPKFLIVLPTRELTIQVRAEIDSLKIHPEQYRIVAIYGGNPINDQINQLRRGADIIAATPGRLIDLLERGVINLSEMQTVCLDEADQMLKQGFEEDVEKILDFVNRKSPYKTQKLLFSATIPRWVEQLSSKFMSKNHVRVDLIKNYQIKTSKTIQHLCISMNRDRRVLNQTIKNLITIYAGGAGSLIIFCQTKREANQLHDSLNLPQLKSLLHGDIPQVNRQYTFRDFKSGKIKCLIATNVAARGLDIPSVDLIIQMEPPKKADDYVHRAGRTGRAGKNGVCITFFCQRQRYLMSEIEKMANIRFREIAEPRPADIMKVTSRQLVNKIKGLEQGLAEYFQDAAKELITDIGAQKALALALAQLSGIKTKPQQFSMQTKAAGFMTYLLTSEGESANRKDLVQFLSTRLQRFSEQDLYHINNLTQKTVVFDMKEVFKRKMHQLIVDLQKKQNFLQSIYRLRVVYDQQTLQNFQEDDQMDFTAEEYEEAIHNKKSLEVVVRGLGYNVDEDIIFKFFKNNGIRIVQINLLRNEMGATGIAFILCLNRQEKEKALNMNSIAPVLENRKISVEEPRKR